MPGCLSCFASCGPEGLKPFRASDLTLNFLWAQPLAGKVMRPVLTMTTFTARHENRCRRPQRIINNLRLFSKQQQPVSSDFFRHLSVEALQVRSAA